MWAPVHGPRAAYQDPDEPFDASWEHNRRLVLEAEALGYDAALIAQHTMNPRRHGDDQLETWSAAAALAALTNRIELIAAVKPRLFHPVVLAKMALQIENIFGGRFAINLVNAWNRLEFEQAGIPFEDHDARYVYGREWISIVSRLISGELVSHEGENFKILRYQLRPKDLHRPRPLIYVGGESEPARALVADHGDFWFINGQPLGDVEALIGDLRRRPRTGAPIRFGLSAFVIARATEREARETYRHLRELAAKDGDLWSSAKPNIDPKVVMHQTMAKSARVGTNGGTAAGLVGDYNQVAERIRAFHKAGIELFMLQFQPFIPEMARFAREIFPRIGKTLNQASILSDGNSLRPRVSAQTELGAHPARRTKKGK
ncbi:MAG: LLM class flavin-dependent oxidoreductase [Hyphomicrobiaceae bacterium]